MNKEMRGKVVLGTTYNTAIGLFKPVEYERGKLKYKKFVPLFADPNQRLDGRYIDKDGRRLRRKHFYNVAKEIAPGVPMQPHHRELAENDYQIGTL